jgi:CRP-like cAMP-binding protein
MSLSSRSDEAGKIAFLKQISPFSALSEAELAVLVNDFRPVTYRKGESIFRQGDMSYQLYIVRQGLVRIFKYSLSGEETSIVIFAERNVFGEFAAIDNQPRSATAKALKPTALLELSQATLLRRMEEIPALGLGMARLLVEKVRWTANYAEAVAQYDAASRLLHILLVYNERLGKRQDDGSYLLDLELNQADLASLVGAQRGWVNRILQDWRKRGLLEHQGGQIIILDLARAEQERASRMEGGQDGEEW